jgi:hypothetical protein
MPSRDAPQITVYLDGLAVPNIQAMRVERSVGGARLDHAVLRVAGGSQLYVENLQLPHGVNPLVVIKGTLADGKQKTFFVGKATRQRITIDEHTESNEFVAQLAEYLFGNPLEFFEDYDVAAKTTAISFRPLVFNPEIDGRTYGNKRASTFAIFDSNLFIDTEALRSDPARKYQGEPPLPAPGTPDTVNLWDLSEAVYYLCTNLNLLETYVHNPTLAVLRSVIDDEHDLVRNLHIPFGTYLPKALDLLLEPLGYSWYVAIDDKTAALTIRVFQRGVGTAVTSVYLQPRGAQLNLAPDSGDELSNTCAVEIDYDIGSLYNQVVAFGDYEEYESTFTLFPLWDATKDNLIAYPPQLWTGAPDFVKNGFHDVWRKWGLNEAGDYIGLRPEIQRPYPFDELGLSASQTLPRRRRFLPTLTLGPDLRPIGHLKGCTLELYSPYWKEGAGWRQVTAGCELLETECAVYFGDREIPQEILMLAQSAPVVGGFATQHSAASQIKIRITACVRFDRLYTRVLREKSSPNDETHTLVLDWAHLFHYRQVTQTSQYYADVASGAKLATQDNDYAAMNAFCDRIRQAWDMAAVHGPLTIEGVDDWRDPPAYDVGMSVDALVGRDVSFNAVASGKAYPQIVGITYDFQRQRTTLQLERFREPPRFLHRGDGEITDAGVIH